VNWIQLAQNRDRLRASARRWWTFRIWCWLVADLFPLVECLVSGNKIIDLQFLYHFPVLGNVTLNYNTAFVRKQRLASPAVSRVVTIRNSRDCLQVTAVWMCMSGEDNDCWSLESFGMLTLKLTDVSEMYSASIIRAVNTRTASRRLSPPFPVLSFPPLPSYRTP
jgi:hypothetical protein